VLWGNARIAELVRRPLEQLMGSAWTRCLAPAQQGAFEALLKVADHGARGEFTVVTGDGARLPVQVSAHGVVVDDAQVVAVLVTDLTDRKSAEEALRQAAERLETRIAGLQEKLSAMESFSYNIAHDLRAPLTAIAGFAGVLREDFGERLPRRGRDCIRRILRGADRLDGFIQNVLQHSRMAHVELELKAVAVDRLLGPVIECYTAPNARKAEINVTLPLPVVWADETALTQCISNLFGNAVKYTRPGQVPVIKVWAESREDWVRLWFEDCGIGIEKSAQERIFEAFERLDTGGHYEGTGIGLAIVRKAIARMGGRVGVESEAGRGSRFWLELKRASAGANG
jgi:signal transduction histidine kinase